MIGAEDLYAFRALWRHYRACRRNKRNTDNALAFDSGDSSTVEEDARGPVL